jgi:hypothetical protein
MCACCWLFLRLGYVFGYFFFEEALLDFFADFFAGAFLAPPFDPEDFFADLAAFFVGIGCRCSFYFFNLTTRYCACFFLVAKSNWRTTC